MLRAAFFLRFSRSAPRKTHRVSSPTARSVFSACINYPALLACKYGTIFQIVPYTKVKADLVGLEFGEKLPC